MTTLVDSTKSGVSDWEKPATVQLGVTWLNPVVHFKPVSRASVVGRGPDVDLSLSDAKVSRRHALLEPDGEQLKVTDLESTHGIFVNRVKSSQALLIERDVLRLGDSVGIVTRKLDSRASSDLVLSAKSQLVFEQASLAAKSRAAIALIAASGAGKSTLASLIHQWSDSRELLVLDCASPYDLAALSEAVATGPQKTLFLRHAHQIPLSWQGALVQLLDANRRCRLIYSSAVPLSEGELVPELVSRLRASVELTLPPLRERPEEAVAAFVLAAQALGCTNFQARLIEQVACHEWQCFREVAQAARGAAALSDGGSRLRLDHLPGQFRKRGLTNVGSDKAAVTARRLRAALLDCELNVSRAAQVVGISRQYAYRMIAKRPEFERLMQGRKGVSSTKLADAEKE